MALQLNTEQTKAISHTEGPLLIVAGAGSGKTRVIVERILHLLEKGVDPKQILTLTFTNKAAQEMRTRIAERTKWTKTAGKLLMNTFHSFGMRTLRRQCKLIGYREQFSIYDTGDSLDCLRTIAAERKQTLDYLELKSAQAAISAVKTERQPWNSHTLPYKELYQEYQRYLKAYNAFDFDDLIVSPVKIWKEFPEALEYYRQRFQYILVDEFQDTSLMQYKMLREMALVHRNLCCVGDDDQSIYSWRGANIENIRSFERDFPERAEIRLERNYRSSKTILSAANAIIRHNQQRKEKELRAEREIAENPIVCVFPEDDTAEAQFVCKTIRQLRSLHCESIGILLRTNSLMRVLEAQLLENRLPYTVSGGQSFFQRGEIKDLICYLRVIQNPLDDVSLLRVINKPNRRIGPKSIEKLSAMAKQKFLSLYETMSEIVFGAESAHQELIANYSDFVALIEEFRPQFLAGPSAGDSIFYGDLAQQLLEEVDYFGYLLQQFPERPQSAKYRYDNLLNLCEMLRQWQRNRSGREATLDLWLKRISLTTYEENHQDQEGKINLSTIHAAKGLEFDAVFLCGFEEGILPHSRSLEMEETDKEEERRLFYVALTRARKRLYLSSCKTRSRNGKPIDMQLSSFYNEIPKHLISQEEELSEEDSEAMLRNAMAKLPWL